MQLPTNEMHVKSPVWKMQPAQNTSAKIKGCYSQLPR